MVFKKHSRMKGSDLKEWRKSLALTQSEAATALGLKLRMFQHYEKGDHPIPRTMALACWALRQGRHDFDGQKARKLKEPLALVLAGEDAELRAKKRKKLEQRLSKA